MNIYIIWKFIPRAAPWYGGQRERVIGLTSTSVYRSHGCGYYFGPPHILETVKRYMYNKYRYVPEKYCCQVLFLPKKLETHLSLYHSLGFPCTIFIYFHIRYYVKTIVNIGLFWSPLNHGNSKSNQPRTILARLGKNWFSGFRNAPCPNSSGTSLH